MGVGVCAVGGGFDDGRQGGKAWRKGAFSSSGVSPPPRLLAGHKVGCRVRQGLQLLPPLPHSPLSPPIPRLAPLLFFLLVLVCVVLCLFFFLWLGEGTLLSLRIGYKKNGPVCVP